MDRRRASNAAPDLSGSASAGEARPTHVPGDGEGPGAPSDPAIARLLEGPLFAGVLRFGTPLVVGMALYTTFNLIDMFMISRLENAKAALGALGICDMVAALPTIISNGVSTGTVAIIARRLGEGDRAGVERATWQSMLLVGIFSVVFGAIGLFFSPHVITGVLQARGEVAELATRYLRVLMGGAFSIFFLLQITAVLRALGRSKTAAALLVSGNVLNILLNAVIVYGPGPHPDAFAWARPIALFFDAPRMGLQGTAWATLVGRAVPVVVGFALLARALSALSPGEGFSLKVLRPDRAMLRTLLVVGWPSSVQLVVRIGAILVFLSLINSNYTTATDAHTLTAYSICLRIETLVLFLGMGWGAAASSYVGTNLGAGQRLRAQRAGWIAAGYNAVLAAGMSAVFIYWSGPILGFFEHSPDVLAAGHEYLRWVGPSYVVVAVAVVLSQAMTGAGATMLSLILDATALALGVIPAAIIVAEVVDAPPWGLWLTIAIGNVVIAVVFAIFYAKGKFLENRI